MIIGCHVKMTAPDYILGSVKEAVSYNANALMLYTGAPQNTKRVEIEKLKIAEAKELMEMNRISMDNLIVHAPYLINLANTVKADVAELAGTFLLSEAQRARAIGAKYVVVHPGSYTTATLDEGINSVVKQLNQLSNIPEGIVICLETMAGKGSEVGRTFEELQRILAQLDHPESFGVCLDTCHIHDAGYDLTKFDDVLDEFDRIIGLDWLRVIHLNDSANERGSHKDRHANIGKGKIGFECLMKIAHNDRIKDIPKILETPYIDGKPPYAEEIKLIKEFNKNNS